MSKNPQDSSKAGKEAAQKVADSLSILFNLGRKIKRDPNAGARKLLLDDACSVAFPFKHANCPYNNPEDCGLRDYCVQCSVDTDIQDNSAENG